MSTPDRLPGIEVEWAGGSRPFQARGKIDGHAFSFRYRYGVATLSADQRKVSESYGKPLAACLRPEQFTKLMASLAAAWREDERPR